MKVNWGWVWTIVIATLISAVVIALVRVMVVGGGPRIRFVGEHRYS